jgi:hypothetical protein
MQKGKGSQENVSKVILAMNKTLQVKNPQFNPTFLFYYYSTCPNSRQASSPQLTFCTSFAYSRLELLKLFLF